MVHKLKTKEAACHYGANTKWCTAAESGNMFDQYNRSGPLYVIRTKGDNKKYQFHFESNQFMNDQDKPIEMSDFLKNHPSLTKIKEFEGKHPLTSSKETHLDAAKNPKNYSTHFIRNLIQSTPHVDVLDEIVKNKQSDLGYISSNPNAKEPHLIAALDAGAYALHRIYDHKNATANVKRKAFDIDMSKSKVYQHEFVQLPSVLPEHLDTMYKNGKTEDRMLMNFSLMHKNATREMHEDAMKDPAKHAVVAKSKSAHPDHLEQLAKSKFSFVRANVAGNKKTPKSALDILKNDSDREVAEAAIKNKSSK